MSCLLNLHRQRAKPRRKLPSGADGTFHLTDRLASTFTCSSTEALTPVASIATRSRIRHSLAELES
jgi:hypothetical protein